MKTMLSLWRRCEDDGLAATDLGMSINAPRRSCCEPNDTPVDPNHISSSPAVDQPFMTAISHLIIGGWQLLPVCSCGLLYSNDDSRRSIMTLPSTQVSMCFQQYESLSTMWINHYDVD